jgi:hypothetical protein
MALLQHDAMVVLVVDDVDVEVVDREVEVVELVEVVVVGRSVVVVPRTVELVVELVEVVVVGRSVVVVARTIELVVELVEEVDEVGVGAVVDVVPPGGVAQWAGAGANFRWSRVSVFSTFVPPNSVQ